MEFLKNYKNRQNQIEKVNQSPQKMTTQASGLEVANTNNNLSNLLPAWCKAASIKVSAWTEQNVETWVY